MLVFLILTYENEIINIFSQLDHNRRSGHDDIRMVHVNAVTSEIVSDAINISKIVPANAILSIIDLTQVCPNVPSKNFEGILNNRFVKFLNKL